MMVSLKNVRNCNFDFEPYDAGSNPSISALCFWFCVQIFAQSTSVSSSAISSENSAAAIIESAATEIISTPANSSEQAVLGDDREVAPISEPEGVAVVEEVAADAVDS